MGVTHGGSRAEADLLEQLAGAPERLAAPQPVESPALGQLLPDAQHRVECVHGALHHHRQAPPAHLDAEALVAHGTEVELPELHAPGDARALWQQAHQRPRQTALAAARLADHPQRLTAERQLERHAVDRPHCAAAAVVGQAQVLDGEPVHHASRKRGFTTVSIPSASSMKVTAVSTIRSPGGTTHHQ